jgi:hypothetical protein
MKKLSMIQAQSHQGQQNSVVELTTQICSLIGKEVIKVQALQNIIFPAGLIDIGFSV